MNIGFTGTRKGMTKHQKDKFRFILKMLTPNHFDLFIHGDCIGADDEADTIVRKKYPSIRIVLHPPTSDKYRAFCSSPNIYTYPKKPYLVRNKHIVNKCDILIACPEGKETLSSGTWSTIRYAFKIGKPTIIIPPKE